MVTQCMYEASRAPGLFVCLLVCFVFVSLLVLSLLRFVTNKDKNLHLPAFTTLLSAHACQYIPVSTLGTALSTGFHSELM